MKLDPMNIRLYDILEKLWLKAEIYEEIYQRSEIESLNNYNDRFWWPTTARKTSNEMPKGMYT